jgi:hypothetical protein
VYTELLTDIVDFDGDLLRNIKGIRISQDLFDDLGDNAEDYIVAHAAESRDTVATDQRLLSRPFDYGTAITFPFLGANWQRTRKRPSMNRFITGVASFSPRSLPKRRTWWLSVA